MQQFHGLVSAPIIDYLHPKKGMEVYFKIWLEEQQKTDPTILAGIAFQLAGDGSKLHVVLNENGLGSCRYGWRVLHSSLCYSKAILLPGKERSQ